MKTREIVCKFYICKGSCTKGKNAALYGTCQKCKKYCKKGFLNNEECEKFTDELISEYDIRPTDCKHKKIRCLSGGNQQKLIIGREIANEPKK